MKKLGTYAISTPSCIREIGRRYGERREPHGGCICSQAPGESDRVTEASWSDEASSHDRYRRKAVQMKRFVVVW